MRSQSSRRKFLTKAVAAIALFLIIGIRFLGRVESKASHNGIPAMPGDTTQDQIARAMSAGPNDISASARIVDTDPQGSRVILREGSNGFTCMPRNPNVGGEPAMCMDAASMQWPSDFRARKPKPTNSVPGITHMLAGATQRSDSDPYDTTSPPITVGPHWMIMWPFDPKTSRLMTTHKSTGAYIMWAGSPYGACARHGAALKRFSTSGRSRVGHELWLSGLKQLSEVERKERTWASVSSKSIV
jgi:hypothetical protein